MEIIVLIIRLLAKLFDSAGQSAPTPVDPSRELEIARQIQQRIEQARAAQLQTQAQADPNGPMMARLPPPAPKRVQQQLQKRKAKRQSPPPLPVPQKAVAPAISKLLSEVTPAAQVARPAAVPADARMIGRWLRPQTLRSQFILTEVFQPPLSLRNQHLM